MDEYIEREAAIKAIYESDHFSVRECFGWRAREIEEELRAVPAADVAPVRHGEWRKYYRSGTTVSDGFVSSCCDMWNSRKSDWCPNSGAKMDCAK